MSGCVLLSGRVLEPEAITNYLKCLLLRTKNTLTLEGRFKNITHPCQKGGKYKNKHGREGFVVDFGAREDTIPSRRSPRKDSSRRPQLLDLRVLRSEESSPLRCEAPPPKLVLPYTPPVPDGREPGVRGGRRCDGAEVGDPGKTGPEQGPGVGGRS